MLKRILDLMPNSYDQHLSVETLATNIIEEQCRPLYIFLQKEKKKSNDFLVLRIIEHNVPVPSVVMTKSV